MMFWPKNIAVYGTDGWHTHTFRLIRGDLRSISNIKLANGTGHTKAIKYFFRLKITRRLPYKFAVRSLFICLKYGKFTESNNEMTKLIEFSKLMGTLSITFQFNYLSTTLKYQNSPITNYFESDFPQWSIRSELKYFIRSVFKLLYTQVKKHSYKILCKKLYISC